jgi:dihydroorotase
MLLDQHRDGLYTLPKIVEKAAHNPAVLFGIEDRGFVREGYFADLVAVDIDGTTRVDRGQLRYKCAWSPLEGTELRSSVTLTVLNGSVVYRDGVVADERAARALTFRGRE